MVAPNSVNFSPNTMCVCMSVKCSENCLWAFYVYKICLERPIDVFSVFVVNRVLVSVVSLPRGLIKCCLVVGRDSSFYFLFFLFSREGVSSH